MSSVSAKFNYTQLSGNKKAFVRRAVFAARLYTIDEIQAWSATTLSAELTALLTAVPILPHPLVVPPVTTSNGFSSTAHTPTGSTPSSTPITLGTTPSTPSPSTTGTSGSGGGSTASIVVARQKISGKIGPTDSAAAVAGIPVLATIFDKDFDAYVLACAEATTLFPDITFKLGPAKRLGMSEIVGCTVYLKHGQNDAHGVGMSQFEFHYHYKNDIYHFKRRRGHTSTTRFMKADLLTAQKLGKPGLKGITDRCLAACRAVKP